MDNGAALNRCCFVQCGHKGRVKVRLRCGDNAESLCVCLSPPSPPPPPLCSSRPMWSRAPPWRLISAIRRSLLKPRGMFQTTAGAMHSGVASPWTPDLDQLSTLLRYDTVTLNVPDFLIFILCFYSSCYMSTLLLYLLISMSSPSFFLDFFSSGLYLTSRGTCPILSQLWGSLGKETQSSCLQHHRLNPSMKQRGQTGTGSVSWVLLAFAKGHFLLDQRDDILQMLRSSYKEAVLKGGTAQGPEGDTGGWHRRVTQHAFKTPQPVTAGAKCANLVRFESFPSVVWSLLGISEKWFASSELFQWGWTMKTCLYQDALRLSFRSMNRFGLTVLKEMIC